MEPLRTAWLGSGVWLLADVDLKMPSEVTLSSKSLNNHVSPP
jgi:hypothetical protein